MFRIMTNENTTVYIKDCPENGLAAVDFRRQHGLPPAPTNVICIPEYEEYSESIARVLADWLDSDADFCLFGIQTGLFQSNWHTFSPEAIKAFFDKPSAETIKGLWFDYLDQQTRLQEAKDLLTANGYQVSK